VLRLVIFSKCNYYSVITSDWKGGSRRLVGVK
jgi:hypothetical protein